MAKKTNKESKDVKESKKVQTLRIELDDDVREFSFTVGAKELESGIGKVGAVLAAAGNQAKSFVILATRSKVVLIGYNPDTYVYLLMKTGVAEGDGNFGFLSNIMQGVVKGRQEMEFKFRGGDVVFKDTKSRYTGAFHTQELSSDQVNVVNMKFTEKVKKETDDSDSEKAKRIALHAPQASVLPREVLDCLKEGVALTSIKDVYTGGALLSYMQLDEKGLLTVSAFDNHHFGLYRCKVDAGGMTFRAALPSSHFMIIERMVEGTKAKFHVQNQSIRVEGEGFALVLPATQADPRNYDSIPAFVRALPEPKFVSEFSVAALNSLTENLFTLHSVNTSFELSYEAAAKVVDVKFRTTNGAAQDSFKVKPTTKKSAALKLDPRLLRDILGLIKTQPETKISFMERVLRLDARTKLGGVVSLMSAVA